MSDCIFCKIIAGQIPTTRLYEDDLAIAFADINPQAPTHILVIPRQHLVSLKEATAEDATLLGHLLVVAGKVAAQAGLSDNGFRTVINNGWDAGQTVFHLHVHVLGGRRLGWPPG
jgi:histidine triad (HIT) family protein